VICNFVKQILQNNINNINIKIIININILKNKQIGVIGTTSEGTINRRSSRRKVTIWGII